MAGPAWKSLAIQVPGKDLLKKARNILETLLVYLEVIKTFLETVKAFLKDFGNPLKTLLEALLNLINTLIEALKRTGIYALFDTPDLFLDPKLLRHAGGFQRFKLRWKGSLVDAQDFNRPQPIAGALKGGYVVIVADANGPAKLIALVKILLRFFGQEFLKPKYQPPSNVRVVPVGEKGDPILAVTKVFKNQVKALAIEWSLPTNLPSADPAFQGLATELSQEFFPPKWLIERSAIPLNNEVRSDQIGDPAEAGQVTGTVMTGFINPRPAPGVPANKQIPRKVKVKDQNGDPFIKFQAYAVISPGNNPASFFLGQLGTFRFIDTNVEVDKTYFYRVRAYSGNLSFAENASIGSLSYPLTAITPNMNDGGTLYFEWPSKDPNDPVIVGRPSPIVRGKVPKFNPKFDVVEVLRRLFLTAFSLNFHLPLPPATPLKDALGHDVLDAQGYTVYKPQFAANGDPLPPLTTTDIGRNSLTTLAGALGSYTSVPVIDLDGQLGSVQYVANPATGQLPQMPWQLKRVRYAAARLAVKFAGVFLEVDSTLAENFRQLMQNNLPAGVPTTGGTLTGLTTLEQVVFALTKVDFEQSAVGKAASAALETDVFSTDVFGTSTVDQNTAATYGSAFSDPIVRKNVLRAVNYLLALGYQGVPPNWIQLSLLRDILPWSGQLLYDLLAKIQALYDAFKGVIEELKAFIELLIRKIDVLERFIQFLIEILNYIESLSAGFYFLSVTGLTGDVGQWFDALDVAQNEPPSGPSGYTASITLAYLAVDVAAFEAAFSAIF
jgi:hypothetical protein